MSMSVNKESKETTIVRLTTVFSWSFLCLYLYTVYTEQYESSAFPEESLKIEKLPLHWFCVQFFVLFSVLLFLHVHLSVSQISFSFSLFWRVCTSVLCLFVYCMCNVTFAELQLRETIEKFVAHILSCICVSISRIIGQPCL